MLVGGWLAGWLPTTPRMDEDKSSSPSDSLSSFDFFFPGRAAMIMCDALARSLVKEVRIRTNMQRMRGSDIVYEQN